MVDMVTPAMRTSRYINESRFHAYMSSHSPSSSSFEGGGGGGAFSLIRFFRSKGHVACNFSHGAIHSRSNM